MRDADAGSIDDMPGIDVVVPLCDASAPFATGSATGVADPLGAAAGQVRAGVVSAAMLPTDRTGLAVWAAGDYVLANDRIAVMIEAARPSALYDPWGGKLVGLARVEGGHMVDAADFNESIFLLGRYTVATESVTVLHDGSDGVATIRAVGPLRPLPFIDELTRTIITGDYSGFRAAVDYELRPGAEQIDVYETVDVNNTRPVFVRIVGHGFFQRFRMPLFLPGVGFSNGVGVAPAPWVGFVDDSAVGFAWSSPDGPLTSLLSVSGFDIFTSPSITLPPCAQTRVHVARIVVGGRGLDGLTQAVARVESVAQREVRGTVREADAAPAVGVDVHATMTGAGTYLTRATTDATGAFTLHVPATQSVDLTTWRAGDAVGAPVTVAAGTSTATLTLGATGALHIVATDMTSGVPLPVRVQVLPVGGEPHVPASFGEMQPDNGRMHMVFPTDGDVTLRAPVGMHRVVVSHGFEYELADRTGVMVRAGETTLVSVALRRVVDTTGALCGDFHIHTNRSPDADDSAQLKLASLAADGVEIAVRSDHEFVADFTPLIDSMGLSAWVRGVPSLELTTFIWGHFGIVPLRPDPALPNAGGFNWAHRRPVDVFTEVRRHASAPTIIINHPRTGGGPGAYFDAAGFDRATGVGRAGDWDTDFTAVEFFNDSDFETNRGGTVLDWYSLLAHGRRVFAVGSSDSHHILAFSPVGYPRTCLLLGSDDPRTATPESVRDAVAHGRSSISGGIYLTAQAPGGIGPGQEAMGVGSAVNIRVTVQAPAWVSATRLETIVDGVSQPIVTLDASTADPANPTVRFSRDVSVPVAAGGSYVIFVAHGAPDLSPVFPNRKPFGVTNPIFLRR